MKKILVTSLLFVLLFGAFGFSYAQDINQDLSDQLIRLHIIANSDSEKDQAIKLEVKDYINMYIGSLTEDAKDKEEAEKIIKSSLSSICDKTNEFLTSKKVAYTASCEYGMFEFPTKSYQNITLPSGKYNGLEIKLGNANGHNWWCVMYPPLCFTNEVTAYMSDESNELLKQQLSEKDYAIISAESDEKIPITYQFKIVEFFQNMRQSATGNVYSH